MTHVSVGLLSHQSMELEGVTAQAAREAISMQWDSDTAEIGAFLARGVCAAGVEVRLPRSPVSCLCPRSLTAVTALVSFSVCVCQMLTYPWEYSVTVSSRCGSTRCLSGNRAAVTLPRVTGIQFAAAALAGMAPTVCTETLLAGLRTMLSSRQRKLCRGCKRSQVDVPAIEMQTLDGNVKLNHLPSLLPVDVSLSSACQVCIADLDFAQVHVTSSSHCCL
jgi:hypothetical protein